MFFTYITYNYCFFITIIIFIFMHMHELINICLHCSVETCHTLLKRDLRRNLFTLFGSWAGPYGKPLASTTQSHEEEKSCSELQLYALQAMSGLLCCGPCFNPQSLSEEGAILYQWLDLLLASKDEKVSALLHFCLR